MIYLTYAEIPEQNIGVDFVKGLFGRIEYLDAILKRKNEASVKESLAALVLLQRVMADIGEVTSEMILIKDPNGRPAVSGRSDIDFSLSHTDRFVACAVSNAGNVGVDMERIPKGNRYEKILKRFFLEEEQGKVKNACDFAREWTKKEAAYKQNAKGGSLAETNSGAYALKNIESFFVEEEYLISVCSEISENAIKELKKLEI